MDGYWLLFTQAQGIGARASQRAKSKRLERQGKKPSYVNINQDRSGGCYRFRGGEPIVHPESGRRQLQVRGRRLSAKGLLE